jgi:pimeloyl-ACP methyl ester carboxylesterase
MVMRRECRVIKRIETVTGQTENGLVDFHRQRLRWSEAEAPIPAMVQRATITVPLDYAQPDGEVINLAIVRHAAADPPQRLGVLLVAPDDPGSRGIPLLWQLLPSLPTEVVERYDIVCFDHRFSGDSAPLELGLSMDEIFWVFHSSPDFETECRFQEEIARKAADSALETLPHLTSLNIARDIDVIRGALNEEKISFLGYSYGSYLGAVYTQLFGVHAGRVVLDSVINPEWVWRGLFRAIAASMEAGLTKWAGWAARRGAELQLGDTSETVRCRLDELLAAASRQPVVIPSLPIPLDGALLRLATMALLQSDQTHSLLGDLVRAAVHHESPSSATIEFFGAMFGRPRDESTAAAQLAILCGDHPWPRSKYVYRADARRDGERYPFIGAALSGIKPGAFWAIAPREPGVVIGRDNPAESILLVQSAGDVFAPSHGARRLRELLPHNSRLITVADSVQHRVFPFYRHSEVNEQVCTYLVDGKLPNTDRICANRHPANQSKKGDTCEQDDDRLS